jgi:hypothetical protein
VGSAKSEVLKVRPSHEPILKTADGFYSLIYGELAEECTGIGFRLIGSDIMERQAFIKVYTDLLLTLYT